MIASGSTYILIAMSGLGYRQRQVFEAGAGRLVCRTCGHERILTPVWIDELRANAPGVAAESDLLVHFLRRFRCSECQAKDVDVVRDEEAAKRAGDANGSPLCAECGEAIPLKRLRAMPGTPFCIGCQEEFEKGRPEEGHGPCKQCGAKMVLRVRESVLPTKYFLGCSNYPRCRFVIAGSW